MLENMNDYNTKNAKKISSFFRSLKLKLTGRVKTEPRINISYISIKEARKIAKENRRAIAAVEAKNKIIEPVKMQNNNNVLEIDNLKTYFFTAAGTVRVVDGITFDVPRSKTVGIVGESGCGKSITSLSIMQLLQNGYIVDGQIRFNTVDKIYDIVKTPQEVMQKIRGNNIAMIFQDPMTSLNPVICVGRQIDEVILHHFDEAAARGVINSSGNKKEIAKERTINMLKLVGINPNVYKMYPHELSGGMVQRVMISMALACEPSLIIADEPTTALDVTIQAQILDLLKDIKNKINASIMLITHDLGVVAGMADYVVVMYAGRIVERGTADDIFKNAAHPYTQGLIKSRPVLNKRVERLYNIPGRVPNPILMPDYCYFRDRCKERGAECNAAYPPEKSLSQTHKISCYKNLSASE